MQFTVEKRALQPDADVINVGLCIYASTETGSLY